MVTADEFVVTIDRFVATVDRFVVTADEFVVRVDGVVVTVDRFVVTIDERSVGGKRTFAAVDRSAAVGGRPVAVVEGVRAGCPTCRPFGTGVVMRIS